MSIFTFKVGITFGAQQKPSIAKALNLKFFPGGFVFQSNNLYRHALNHTP
jgi:hypothetical protein